MIYFVQLRFKQHESMQFPTPELSGVYILVQDCTLRVGTCCQHANFSTPEEQ